MQLETQGQWLNRVRTRIWFESWLFLVFVCLLVWVQVRDGFWFPPSLSRVWIAPLESVGPSQFQGDTIPGQALNGPHQLLFGIPFFCWNEWHPFTLTGVSEGARPWILVLPHQVKPEPSNVKQRRRAQMLLKLWSAGEAMTYQLSSGGSW